MSSFLQLGNDIDGEAIYDDSGYSVSLSSDGTIVAIGAIKNDGNGSNSGHVRIYQYNGTSWSQLGDDIDGEGELDNSGYSVSLSSDGTIVAIGAPDNDGNGSDSGHVRVYEYSSGSWSKLGDDIDGDSSIDGSGESVSLSSDGTRVAIGAQSDSNSNGASSGQVRVYEYSGGSWIQVGDDIDGEAAGDKSGVSVSLSGDGTIVAIGARYNDDNGNNSGHVRIYQYNGTSWSQLGDDIDGEGELDNSGKSVSLSSDGTIVAIGANKNDGVEGVDRGHVRVYQYDSGANSWSKLGDDIDGEAADDKSGFSVSLSGDGTIVAIGARDNDGNGSNSGHVRVYEWSGTSWNQFGDDIDGEAAGDNSGFSVSLSSDGTTVAIGATENDVNGTSSGHVRIFSLSSGICFLGNTLVNTDQGKVYFNELTTNNSINNHQIKKVVSVMNKHNTMVLIKKDSFGINVPNKNTYISNNHKILINGNYVEAKNIVDNITVFMKKMPRKKIYNVVLDHHGIMNVNNMIVETLDPLNELAYYKE